MESQYGQDRQGSMWCHSLLLLLLPSPLLALYTITKCCPHNKVLQRPSSDHQSFQCNLSRGVLPDVPVVSPSHLPVPATSHVLLPRENQLCQNAEHYTVKNGLDEVFSDGYVIYRGHERPFECVDYREEGAGEDPQLTAVFCRTPWQNCPEGGTCVQKCCRAGRLLEEGEAVLGCVDHPEALWSPDPYRREGRTLTVSTSFFNQKRRGLKVCHEEFTLLSSGKLQCGGNRTDSREYCVDNYRGNSGGVTEVLVTHPNDCDRNPSNEDKWTWPEVTMMVHSVCASLSLLFLLATFLTYWFIPYYQHIKGKIVLANVTFTALLCTFLLVSHLTSTSSFHPACADTNSLCRFLRDHGCPSLGYAGYFVTMGTFSWVTVFGAHLCWLVGWVQPPEEGGETKFGFPVHKWLGLGLPALTILLTALLKQVLWPQPALPTHTTALAVILSCLSWLVLLLLHLAWTLSRVDAPAINSDNSFLRLASTMALAVPLILTTAIATFHISLDKESAGNPRMGELGRCFISTSSNHLARILLLYHLPILGIVLVNLFIFVSIVRMVYITKRNSWNSIDRKNLQEQLVLYTKLFLVCGLTWIFEPLSSTLEWLDLYGSVARSLTTATSILNLLRGVFLFLVFVSPSRVVEHQTSTRTLTTTCAAGAGRRRSTLTTTYTMVTQSQTKGL